ncbi:hypothetical protein EG68_02041 [Paragonimus skrjabini miyazakii]|uniref:Protein kinase domain-containing protein n=1 Tax=Paragonimus skrjabini miyazakii TaxID=59628 RepID=A0A8S9YZN7_9TREM|nr:hypothetical protein EG68_02041 [Paragonimus skrjabini miyazakii]
MARTVGLLLWSMLVTCCVESFVSSIKWQDFAIGLKFNSDLIACLGSKYALVCEYHSAYIDASVEIHKLDTHWVPENYMHEESRIKAQNVGGYLPRLPTRSLLGLVREHGVLVTNGTMSSVTQEKNTFSKFTFEFASLRMEDAGWYFCTVSYQDLLPVTLYTILSIRSNCDPSPSNFWLVYSTAIFGVLMVVICVAYYLKTATSAVRRLIIVSHPEASSLKTHLNLYEESGISQDYPSSLDSPDIVSTPVVQFEQLRVSSCLSACFVQLRRLFKWKRKPFTEGYEENANGDTTFGHCADTMTHLDNRFTNEYRIRPDKNYEIPRERIVVGSVLGGGAFGVVYSGIAWDLPNHKRGPVAVAIKTLRDNFTESDVIDLMKEMDIMKQLHYHEHVIQLLAVCTQNGAPYLIMECAPYGNLRDYLRNNRSAFQNSPSLVGRLLNYGRQVAEGMHYLSTKSIVHRDLAARNILVSKRDVLKISDFGLTRSVDEYYRKLTNEACFGHSDGVWFMIDHQSLCVTALHRVCSRRLPNWSFGVLFWEIFTLGCAPFKGIDPSSVPALIRAGRRNPKPQFANDAIYELMLHCWAHNPGQRPSFAQLVGALTRLEQEHIMQPEGLVSCSTKMVQSMMNGSQTWSSYLPSSDPETMTTGSLCTHYLEVDSSRINANKIDVCKKVETIEQPSKVVDEFTMSSC